MTLRRTTRGVVSIWQDGITTGEVWNSGFALKHNLVLRTAFLGLKDNIVSSRKEIVLEVGRLLTACKVVLLPGLTSLHLTKKANRLLRLGEM